MKRALHLIAAAALALVATGCANPERSRDLGNPNVTAAVLARQVCSNCHGVTGNAVSPNFPNLAGQTPAYTVAQLNGFKSHGRQDPAGFEYMWGISRMLSDDQIKGLADYYAAQVPETQPIEGDAARAAAGKAIFEAGLTGKNVPACVACHGAKGQGTEAFPRLAGQHADYVVKQLGVFQRSNDRPEGSIMKTVAHELSPDDIENLGAFVQSRAAR
jgi:cytochrome c553